MTKVDLCSSCDGGSVDQLMGVGVDCGSIVGRLMIVMGSVDKI